MKKLTIHYYSDPGHGWGKVSVKNREFQKVKDKISDFSYYWNGHAFLEEDCDLEIFVRQLEKDGIVPVFVPHISRKRYSRIRGYNRFTDAMYFYGGF